MVRELNAVSPKKWQVSVGNVTKAATITLVRLGDAKTKVKVRLAAIDVRGATSTFSSVYPLILEAEYQGCWQGRLVKHAVASE